MGIDSIKPVTTAHPNEHSLSQILAREGELLKSLPHTITDGVNERVQGAISNPLKTTAEVAGAIAIGVGLSVARKNPQALFGLCGTLSKYAPRAGAVLLTADVANRALVPMVDTAINPETLDLNKQRLGRNLGAAAIDYPLMLAAGAGGYKLGLQSAISNRAATAMASVEAVVPRPAARLLANATGEAKVGRFDFERFGNRTTEADGSRVFSRPDKDLRFYENRELRVSPDGTRTFKRVDGQTYTEHPDGSRVWEDKLVSRGSDNWRMIREGTDGSRHVEYANGRSETIGPDGTKIRTINDGFGVSQVETVRPDGSSVTTFPKNETVAAIRRSLIDSGADVRTRPPLLLKIETAPDGRYQLHYSDGTIKNPWITAS